LRPYLLICLCVALSSCYKGNETAQLRHHDNGFCKPCVAIFDVYNHSSSTLPWDLSEEFTTELVSRIKTEDKLYLVREEEIAWQYPIQVEKISPFHQDDWLKENHPNVEFITFVEIVDHSVVPRLSKEQTEVKNPSYDLKLCLRIKVVDVRDDIPVIVLQELINESYFIPSQLSGIDYNKTKWGKTLFALTPVGLAHSRITKEISKRIEDYILLASSHK
jgi:hypothetical protein